MKSNRPFRPLSGLRDLVNRDFSVDNLHDLALDFNLDYDELEGSSKGRRVVAFIENMVRDGLIVEFIERCQELRPRAKFQPFLEAARQNPQAFELRSSDYEKAAPETAVYQALNKALGLIEAQSLKIEQMTHLHEQPLSSDQTRISKEAINQNSKSWAKSSKIGSSIHSSIGQPHKYTDTNEQGARKSPRGGRLHKEIEQLEAHITEEIDGFLAGIRQKMEDLKLRLNEQQQTTQDGALQATRKSFGFQGKGKAAFPIGKSPFAQK